EVAPRVHLEDAEHALLAPSLGHAVGEEAPVVARVEPVEGGGPVLGEPRGIEEHAVLSVPALTQVEDRLLLVSGPPLMEIAVSADGGCGNEADREEDAQPLADGGRERDRVENGPRVPPLGLRPAADLFRVSVF